MVKFVKESLNNSLILLRRKNRENQHFLNSLTISGFVLFRNFDFRRFFSWISDKAIIQSLLKFIVSFFFIVSMWNLNAEEDEHREYLKYVREVTRQFEEEMKNEYGFHCYAGGGSMPYDVAELDVRFDSNRQATIEIARELEVKATQRFLQIINGHEKIRPFLREYPFSAKRAKVSISFDDKKKDGSTRSGVDFVYHVRGKIFYRTIDPKTDNYIGLAEEPYEEALKKVQESEKGKTHEIKR